MECLCTRKMVRSTWYMVNSTWLLSQSIFDGSRVRLFSVSVGNFVYLISFDNTIYITDMDRSSCAAALRRVDIYFYLSGRSSLVYIAYFIGGR